MKRIGIIVASFFGIGFMPIAPGTWASLAAALIVYFTPLGLAPFPIRVMVTAAVYAAGVPAAAACERHFGKKDPRPCVIDEVAGQLVGIWLLPRQAGFYISAFFLFRLFDIWKPFPIRKSEALPHGFGIMTDDILAGFYTLVILLVVRHFFLS